MIGPLHCELVRGWRITGFGIRDQVFLDLANLAHLTLEDAGRGKIEFGAVHLGRDLDLDIECGRKIGSDLSPKQRRSCGLRTVSVAKAVR